MLSHASASLSMDQSLGNARKFIAGEGYMYPSLFLLKKGGPIVTSYEHPSVLHIDSDDDTGDPEKVYNTVVMFKNVKKEDEDAINLVARELAAKTCPDAVGLIMVVLYRQFTQQEHKKLPGDYQAAMDPDALRAVHGCYYVKGDRDPAMLLIPFLDRTVGIKDEEDGPVSAIAGKKRDITFVQSVWVYKDKTLDPWLKYPY